MYDLWILPGFKARRVKDPGDSCSYHSYEVVHDFSTRLDYIIVTYTASGTGSRNTCIHIWRLIHV